MKINFHGWKRSDKKYAIHIGVLPERKKPALYMLIYADNGELSYYPLAYFKGEDEALEAIEALDELIESLKE